MRTLYTWTTRTTHVDLRFDDKMPKLPAIINCNIITQKYIGIHLTLRLRHISHTFGLCRENAQAVHSHGTDQKHRSRTNGWRVNGQPVNPGSVVYMEGWPGSAVHLEGWPLYILLATMCARMTRRCCASLACRKQKIKRKLIFQR